MQQTLKSSHSLFVVIFHLSTDKSRWWQAGEKGIRATNFNINPPWLREGFGLASPGIIASMNYIGISLHMQLHCVCHIGARSIGLPAIFGQGGGKPFAQKILASCPNFYKTVEKNEGHTMQQHRPYWHMKVPRYSFSGSIPAKFEHKLGRHKQTLGSLRYGNYGLRNHGWTSVVLCL